MDKKLYQAGLIVWAILMVLAVVFYKERSIMLDNALFLFEMAKNDNFSIQRNRFIAALPELLPLLAIKLSIPMKGLLIAWSVGFMAYHAACYVICGILKNYKLGICLLLSHTMILSHSFFWHLSELQLGISLLFPFLALAINKGRPLPFYIRNPLLLALLITLTFSHPIFTLAFFFVIVFSFFNPKVGLSRKQLIGFTVVFICILIVQKIFFFDKHGMKNAKNLVKFFPDYLNLYSNTRLLTNIRHIYYWLPILFTTVLIFHLSKKEFYKLLIVLGAFFGFLLLVNVSFPYPDTPDFYKENLYITLCFILAFPIVYDVLPGIKNRNFIYVAFALLLTTAIYRVYNTRSIYRDRLDLYRGCMAKTGNEKILAPFTDNLQGSMMMEWASPYEFWLLSTVEKDTTASIIIHKNPQELSWALHDRKSYLTTWGFFPYQDMNPTYFKLYDTSKKYRMHEYK